MFTIDTAKGVHYACNLRAKDHRIYVHDKYYNDIAGHQWNPDEQDQMVSIKENSIGIGTLSDGKVSVQIEICDSPNAEETQVWDWFSTCEIYVPSGKLVIRNTTDDLSNAPQVEVPQVKYKASIGHSKPDRLPFGFEHSERVKIVLHPFNGVIF